MPNALYACLQDEDKIVAFSIDAETGQLTRQAEVPASGGPSVMAISPDRRTLYVGHRTRPAISSFRVDQATGGLTLLGTVAQEHAPTFLAPDRTGKYLLCAYYQGGGAAVHPLLDNRRTANTCRCDRGPETSARAPVRPSRARSARRWPGRPGSSRSQVGCDARHTACAGPG